MTQHRPRGGRRSKLWIPVPLALLGLLTLLACQSPVDPVELAFFDVTVVDPGSGAGTPNRTVLIDGGAIVSIEEASEPPAALEVVEGRGRFLMPGLIDAHVHVDHPDELALYPARGVTGILVLRGLPKHLAWRAEIARGERFGPRLRTTGDYLDGDPATMRPMTSLSSVPDARAVVADQVAAGYDFIKVYTRLSAEQLAAIVETAGEAGVCAVGHGGRNYPLEHLVSAGQANIAHGQDLVRWYMEDRDDPAELEAVVAALAGSGTTVTPNLSWTDGLIAQGADLEELLGRADASTLHPAVFQPFRRENNRFAGSADEWLEDVRARFEVEKELTLRLHEAGVELLAGTDASTAGVYPGSSLHRELELLVAAGLSPAQALTAATAAPGRLFARCAGADPRTGTVAAGAPADLVLVKGNPLADIRATREVEGVVLAGEWHPRESLDARLDRLATDYAALGPEVVELEKRLFGGEAGAARELFDQVRERRPGEILFSQYVPFFVGYGFLYGPDGYSEDPDRLAVALNLYEIYAETYPEFHSSHYQLGLAEEANGLVERAAESFRQTLAIHPYHREAQEALARVTAVPD